MDEIIYAVLTGSATEEEKILFHELMDQKENLQLFNQFKKIWEEAAEVKYYKEYNTKRAFYELSKKVEANKKQKRRLIRWTVSGIAASILFLLGLFGLMGFPDFKLHHSLVLFKTEMGNRSTLILPDSSKVWLDSQSQISFNNDFGKSNRNISLVGEGYFEVKHSDKPFIVDVKDFKIKVYGTKFNVSAYPDDNSIQTCLESGQISINQEGKKELIVIPGQLISYEKNTATFKTRMVDPEKYLAWRSNKMYMQNESMNELSKKLQRKYNVVISFVPESLGEKVHYSGIFTNEDITEVLDAISIASGLKYSKKDNEYIIEKK
jgi:ferric-dicitrate binding protein FerR (iron transport regulator)